jgi:indole-3-glycerol phosphate synthase
MLEEIIKTKKQEVKELKGTLKMTKNFEKGLSPARDFLAALKKRGTRLIAETKKASPSAGLLMKDYDAAKIALEYEKSGAAAISVLTDSKYFQGTLADMEKVKAAVKLPVLRKDFIIDESQIYESRMHGADAILLIARILRTEKLKRFITISRDLGMEPLVEVHSVIEARSALEAGAAIIGINNRDLDTLKTDIGVTSDIIKALPKLKEKIIVSESGIKGKDDIRTLESLGVRAFLVGEALLSSKDMPSKLRELIS